MGCPIYPAFLHYKIGQLLKRLRKWNRQQAPHQFVTVVLALATPKPKTSMRYWTRFVEMLRAVPSRPLVKPQVKLESCRSVHAVTRDNQNRGQTPICVPMSRERSPVVGQPFTQLRA